LADEKTGWDSKKREKIGTKMTGGFATMMANERTKISAKA